MSIFTRLFPIVLSNFLGFVGKRIRWSLLELNCSEEFDNLFVTQCLQNRYSIS